MAMVFVGLGTAMGIAGTILYSKSLAAYSETGEDFHEIRASRNYNYVSPLLECEANAYSTIENVNGLKDKLTAKIEEQKRSGNITFASVYFKDLNHNSWFGINEKAKFAPASLLKVPVLMTFYKKSEENPSVLNQKLVAERYNYQDIQNILPQNPLEEDKQYTIQELIDRMIIQSDNNAYLMLSNIIDEPTLVEVYNDIGINIQKVSQENPEADFINVREYATIFRVLYNASYLSEQTSEKALSLLTETSYNDGLVKYLKGVKVAHKFGERRNLDTGETQLHDCGIVYYPGNPYLICVMTKGHDFSKQAEVIATLSQEAYKNWSKAH
jgi:beta-lactamase class A